MTSKTWKVLHRLPTAGDIYSVSFAPDNQTLATGSWKGAVQLWNWKSGKQIRVVQAALNSAASATSYTLVLFSPNSKLLSTSCWQDAAVKLWDASTGRQVRAIAGGVTIPMQSGGNLVYGINTQAWSPDSKKLVTDSGLAMVLWDITTGQILHKFYEGDAKFSAHDVAFSPDGKWVATASRNNTVDVWNVP